MLTKLRGTLTLDIEVEADDLIAAKYLAKEEMRRKSSEVLSRTEKVLISDAWVNDVVTMEELMNDPNLI